MARAGAPARQFCRASLCESFPCTLPARPFSSASLYESYLRGIPPRSSEAHCKVATHCFLPSSPYSLPSTFFPLFPTLEAHCKVTKHYFLHSSPCSLKHARQLCRARRKPTA